MKNINILIVVLLLFMFFVGNSFAQELRIISVNEPPANYLNLSGVPDGYVVEIVNSIQKKIGTNIAIEFVPEARALNDIKTKENTVFFSLSKTPFRNKAYQWIGQVMTKRWSVYSLKSSDITIDSLTQLQELPMIGVVRGDVREEWMINHNFTNLYSVTNHHQNIQRLLKGRISAFVYESQGLSYICQELNIDLSLFKPIYTLKTSNVYIVMSIETKPELFARWQQAFIELTEEGEIERIAESWQAKLWHRHSIDSDVVNGILNF